MKLEPLMTLRASIGKSDFVGAAAFGTRAIAEVTGGSFEGERLRGEVLTPGGDWFLVDGRGFGHLDVRLTLRTDDGAVIYVQYLGLMEQNETIQRALREGRETAFGDAYFVTQPRFETGSDEYAWLNGLLAVGEGRLLQGGVEYRLYACRPTAS